jgi:hypothetical protein
LIRATVLRRLFGLAERLIPPALLPRLDAETLIAASGADPTPAAREGLRRLLAAMSKDTALTLFGRFSVRYDMLRLLRNAAKIEQAHRENPALGNSPVTAPIFILGLPRSGTTFLHTLLAEDSANLVPRNWQTLNPAPRPANFDPTRDATAKKVNRQLKLFAGMAPGFADLHPIHADSPQECSEITAHVFESLRFDTTFRVPDYLAWLETQGDLAGFRFHKKFLQFLQSGMAGSWVLKCPDHTFSLDSILSVYPDARFILVHRDPVDVFASVAHLTEVLRKPFLRNIDTAEIGAQVAARWIDGANRLVAFDHRTDIAPARKIHVQHDTLIAHPMQVIAQIYQQFGLPLSTAAETSMQRSLRARPRGGYPTHAPYSLNRFSISPEQLKPHFAPYVKTYCA